MSIGISDLEWRCRESQLSSLLMPSSPVSPIDLHVGGVILTKEIAFDWESLPKGSVIVDVGGGVGASSMPIAQKFDRLELVVQDHPATVEEAKKVRRF
jgi:O-methyltransferase domain